MDTEAWQATVHGVAKSQTWWTWMEVVVVVMVMVGELKKDN